MSSEGRKRLLRTLEVPGAAIILSQHRLVLIVSISQPLEPKLEVLCLQSWIF